MNKMLQSITISRVIKFYFYFDPNTMMSKANSDRQSFTCHSDQPQTENYSKVYYPKDKSKIHETLPKYAPSITKSDPSTKDSNVHKFIGKDQSYSKGPPSYSEFSKPEDTGQKISKGEYPQKKGFAKSEGDKAKIRQERFQDGRQPSSKKELQASNEAAKNYNDDEDLELEEDWKVVGTSTELEKPYIRLTREPDPSIIRPEPVLKRSLEMLLEKWKKGDISEGYVMDQFRSIRQDLTVQQIRNELTVRVYEENARICLECQNINHYNQCQSQLMDLYEQGISSENRLVEFSKFFYLTLKEFFAYRLIFYTLAEMTAELNRALNRLSHQDLSNEHIKFALKFQHLFALENYKALFSAYRNQKASYRYLIDMFIHRIRLRALKTITKSFGEKISTAYLQELLGFTDINECQNFISTSKGVMSEDKEFLMNKESFKVYENHPWMEVKLVNYKFLVSQNLI